MTAVLATALLALAILDGALAGFRSSAGRTGLIDHRRDDRQAARRGTGLACALLTPAVAVASADVAIRPGHLQDYSRAGTAMLAVYGPYALLVLTALACYATLNWQLKYLASALILGPFTLLRPGVAILGAALAMALARDVVTALAAGLSVMAVLAVEPLAGRLWYAKPAPAAPRGSLHTLPDNMSSLHARRISPPARPERGNMRAHYHQSASKLGDADSATGATDVNLAVTLRYPPCC